MKTEKSEIVENERSVPEELIKDDNEIVIENIKKTNGYIINGAVKVENDIDNTTEIVEGIQKEKEEMVINSKKVESENELVEKLVEDTTKNIFKEQTALDTDKMENIDTQKTSQEESTSAEKYLENLLEKGATDYITEEIMELPDYYDEDLLTRGQQYLSKFRLIVFNGMLSGLLAVIAIPSILKVLKATRQSSTTPLSYRRYTRTVFHTISWFQYPLKPGTNSWKSIAMVRKAHLKSSKLSEKRNSGQISQKDLALTQFGFMGFYCIHTDVIGLADDDFKESTVHLWRVLGYLLGIKEEYNLCTDSWKTTKERIDLMLDKVYRPALENTSEEFDELTKTLINGLKPSYPVLEWDTSIYFTKYSAKCANYEYHDSDDFGGDEKCKEYKKLSWWNRMTVDYGIFIYEKLYHYTVFRNFFNFRLWLYEMWARYLPYMAMFKFGFKWAYIRIFTGKNEAVSLQIE